MTYEAKIVLDSVGPNGARLTTFELTYPRMVHAEFMTHRMFSRNSASSRAIPTKDLMARIENSPAWPVWWGKNQSGMQAREELDNSTREIVEVLWGVAKDSALGFTRMLHRLGLHKQLANRLIEPWMDITVVASATELSNAWGLRVHTDAQPEFMTVMRKAYVAQRNNKPRELKAGEWHLPYVTGYDEETLRSEGGDADHRLRRISVGRCAAVSYLNQDKRDPAGDLARTSKLLLSGHMSPFEHVAMAMNEYEWGIYAREQADRWIHDRVPMGNLWGWRQYRKDLRNEHDFSIDHPVQA